MKENKEPLTAEEFLMSEGINLMSTSLISYIDGRMCQPDLKYLLSRYSELKIQEYREYKSE